MQRIDHALISPSLGTQRVLSSFHFGTHAGGSKVYIQASLHAEELPGMLVAHHLRALLEAAEAAGQLRGEVVLVPMANPIGLAQRINHKPLGRFELDSAENFNRNYPNLTKAVLPGLQARLNQDPEHNVRAVRGAIASYLRNWQPLSELQSLRKTLLQLSHDADLFLDLHCDSEAVMHFYCEESCWPQLAPLAHFMQSEAILLARDSGGGPLDECLSGVWWQLAEALQAAGHAHPIPQGCCSTTIELRGEADVSHAYARQDAQALFSYLQYIGVLHCDSPPSPPAPRCAPTPLAGSQTVRATVPGVVVFAAQPGEHLRVGALVAEVINPLTAESSPVRAEVDGVLYARVKDRYVTAGCELGKIAGALAFRVGPLLGD